MPGMTAHYSHGGPEWEAKLREAVKKLSDGMSDGMSGSLEQIREGIEKLEREKGFEPSALALAIHGLGVVEVVEKSAIPPPHLHKH